MIVDLLHRLALQRRSIRRSQVWQAVVPEVRRVRVLPLALIPPLKQSFEQEENAFRMANVDAIRSNEIYLSFLSSLQLWDWPSS